MVSRGKTVELTDWHKALLDFIVELRRANGLRTNIQRKTIVESLIVGYAKQVAAGISDPVVRSSLIILINNVEKQ